MTIYACIATRNEAATIGPLVAALRAQGLGVIVEDESDNAATLRAALAAGAQVTWTPGGQRTGLGPSLMRAWRTALSRGATAIVQLDAGGSHDPAASARLLDFLAQHPACAVVVGSRFCPGGQYHGNPIRQAASRLAAGLCRARAPAAWRVRGYWPADWTSGYRAFRAATARWLLARDFHATGHAWQIEVLLHLFHAGMPVGEVPITYVAGHSALNWRSITEAYQIWRLI